MAKHDVKITIPSAALGKSDVVLEIRRDGKPLGKLEVSNGAIVWIPSHSKGGTFRLWWKDFDALMREQGERISAASSRDESGD